jgi:hypothetical protein
VYEKNLKVLPTFAVVLAYPGLWMRDLDTGIDAIKVVHGEQGLALHKPLSPAGAVVGKSRVAGVVDKGEGRGALVMVERKIYAKGSGELIATVAQTAFCRGDGGFGGRPGRRRNRTNCRRAPPISSATSQHRRKPRSSIASAPTSIPCTSTRTSPKPPASPSPSCMASPLTESRDTRS